MDDDLQVAVCTSFHLLYPTSGDRMLINLFDFAPRLSLSYKRRIISNQI